jgi:tetratricopeptide (TPR) repeat protein
MHRAYNNLAGQLWGLGRLQEASEQLRASRAVVERYGNVAELRWLDGVTVWDLDLRGEWNEALRRADAFVASCALSPHYLEWSVRASRVPIYLSRGDRALALADCKAALDQTRPIGATGGLHDVLVLWVRVLLASGRAPEAATVLDELMTTISDLSFLKARGLARPMLQVGREQEFLRMAKASRRSPWLNAEIATAERRFDQAARIYEAIGARGDEAESRMAAAEAAAAKGRRAEAEGQLSRALEFYGRVGATEYIRAGKALLASLANEAP